jgi:hypothetical protein
VGLLLHGGLAFQDPLYGPAFTALWRRYNGGDPTTTRTSSRKNSSRSNEGSAAAAPVVVDLRVMLVLLLVVERCRGQASRWSPYLNILPASYGELEGRRGTREAMGCLGQWLAAVLCVTCHSGSSRSFLSIPTHPPPCTMQYILQSTIKSKAPEIKH